MTSFLIGAVAAAVAAYLFDPDRGRSRRARLADQAAAGLRDVKETVKASAEYQQGVVKGAAHDLKEAVTPDDSFSDDTLLQKVRSEAVGRLNGSTADLEIDITDGRVRLSGRLDSAEDRDRLLELIGQVEGVSGIEDQTRIQ
ncbi:MAG: BON domain-containing protein [Actinobacteria bacterium]|nr:BON domain-containing protein [Actinomycetota bacterium]